MTMNTFNPSYGDNLRLRRLRYRNLTSAATSVRVRSEQFEQERQLLRRIPGQIEVLHIADGQLGILIAEVRRVDDEHRRAHRIFCIGDARHAPTRSPTAVPARAP